MAGKIIIPAVKAHYRLGVAYEKEENMRKVIKGYKKFLEIWKGADFNSPQVNDAKARIAKFEAISKK